MGRTVSLDYSQCPMQGEQTYAHVFPGKVKEHCLHLFALSSLLISIYFLLRVSVLPVSMYVYHAHS